MSPFVPAKLKAGIYAPCPTFFHGDNEEIDFETTCKHIINLAKVGVSPVVLGSMGEATHLSFEERNQVVQAAVDAIKEAGSNEKVPIIAGCGAGSTKETLKLCEGAKKAGATAAMVIAPSYFAGALDREALLTFFTTVCEKSPLPVLLYNYPGASAGIDLDSDLIIQIMDTCPNAVGIKLTCGAVGKLSRLAAHRRSAGNGGDFFIVNGFTDHLLPSATLGTAGAIAGFANVCPKMSVKLFKLCQAACTPGALNSKAMAEAVKLQGVVSQGDWVMAKVGVAGTKRLLQQRHGYGGNPRLPLLPFKPECVGDLEQAMKAIFQVEDTL